MAVTAGPTVKDAAGRRGNTKEPQSRPLVGGEGVGGQGRGGLSGRSCRCSGRRKQRFDRDQVREGGALLVGEAAANAIRVERGLTLLGGQAAEIAKGVGDGLAAFGRKIGELGHGAADLLALLGREVLHGFGAGKDTLALDRGHGIELREPLAHALLHLGGEIVKSGLTLEGALLFGEGEVAVPGHPLGQVLLILLRADGAARGRGRPAVGPSLSEYRRCGDGGCEKKRADGFEEISGCGV